MLTKSTKQRHFSSQTLELTNTSLDCSTFLSQKKNASISLKTNTFDFSPTSKPENFQRKSKENPSLLRLDHKSLGTLNFQDLQGNLQVLVLNDCKLRELPLDFSNFSNLKELSLDFNYLTKIPVALPESIALETFSIKRNLLEILPENYLKWSVSLSSFDVSFNQIDRLEESLSSLKSLRRLMLNNNYFIKIPASLFEMSASLEEFGLDWFKYTFPPLPFIISGEILRNFMRFCEFLASNSKVFFTFLDLIQNFSSKPLDFSKLFSKKRTLIHKSAFENDIGVLRSLIVLLPNALNELDSENYSALFLSILEENYNATKILLYSGADPSVGVGMLGGCLHLAVVKKEVFLLQDLLRKGAAPNSVDQLGNSPLHLLFSTFSNNVQKAEKMGKILMEFNADPHLQNKELWNPLHLAVKCEQLEALRWVLQYNRGETGVFDLNTPGGEVSMTPLHLAGHQGNREIFKLLLEAGCDYSKMDALDRLPKNLCVSDQFLLKLIKSKEKRDIFKAIQVKRPSNIKKKLTINIEENDNTDEIPHKITLPSTLSPCNTVLFSNKSKYFSNQNKVNPRIFEESDRNDENINGDLDESIDNKRHKTIRVILKSPNNIEKIEQYQNVRMSYFRRSMGNSLGISNKSLNKTQSFLDGSGISLKSFSFQNLENMIEVLNYNNEKLRHELVKMNEVKREIEDVFFHLNGVLNLQQKEMTLLRNLGAEVKLLEDLFKEDYQKWGENWKEFEKIKGSLNKKGLVHIECNNFLLNTLFSRLLSKGRMNENNHYKASNLRVCLLILRQVVGFVGVAGFKHAFKGFLNRNELKAGKFNNQVLVYEIFNILNF